MKYISYILSLSSIFNVIFAQICGVVVPENPLSYQGLNTPYILKSLNNKTDDCSVLKQRSTVFIEIVIFDIVSSTFYIYNPLVVNDLGQIKNIIKTDQLPVHNVVGIWFGSNDVTFKLLDSNNSLHFGDCVDGYNNSVFGNFAYCNAKIFFETVDKYKFYIPDIGKTINDFDCLTTRSFEFNQQYHISSVVSSYIIYQDQKVAIKSFNNLSIFEPPLYVIINKSNGRILNSYISIATRCNTFIGYDFIDQYNRKSSIVLNELQGSLDKQQIFIPSTHPSVMMNGYPDLNKLNLYRIGLNQPVVTGIHINDSIIYCNGIYNKTPVFLYNHYDLLTNYNTPDDTLGNNLINVMISRFLSSWNTYDCGNILKVPFPIKYEKDYNNVIVSNNIMNKSKDYNTENNTVFNSYIIGLIVVSILVIIICMFTVRERIKRTKSKNQVIELKEIKEDQEKMILEMKKNQDELDDNYDNLHKKHIELEQKLMNIIIVDDFKKSKEIIQNKIETERHIMKERLKERLDNKKIKN